MAKCVMKINSFKIPIIYFFDGGTDSIQSIDTLLPEFSI